MLQIKKTSKGIYKAVVNNQQLDSINVSWMIRSTADAVEYVEEDYFTLYIHDRKVFDLLITLTAKEIPRNVDLVFFDLSQWREFAQLTLSIDFFSEGYRTRFDSKSELENWDFVFSFLVFQETFSNVWKEKNNYLGKLEFDKKQASLQVEFVSQNLDSPIENDIRAYLELLQDCYTETIKRVRLITEKHSIVLPFQFPEEIKIYCEQYLLYFTQFLQDLGINATSNIRDIGRRKHF